MAGMQVLTMAKAGARTGGAALVIGLLATASAAAQSCLCGTPADLAVAAEAGLDREWIVQIPFDSAGWRLEHVVVGRSIVVAQAGDGTVAAVATRRQPGGPRPGGVTWATHRSRGLGPIAPAGIGENLVTVATGSLLRAYDAEDGRLRWERELPTVASTTAVPSAGWIYAPLDGGGVVRYPADPLATVAPDDRAVTDRAAGEDGESAGGQTPEGSADPRAGELLDPLTINAGAEVDFPPLPYAGGAAWVDSAGRVAAILRAPGFDSRMDLDLGQPVSGPPAVFDGDLILATRGGDMVRLARLPRGWVARTGVTRIQIGDDPDDAEEFAFNGWYTRLPEEPEGGPLVGRGTVVVSLGPAGMAALSARTGDLLWQVPAVGRPVAIIGSRVWSHDATGFLTARDLATGGRRERLCLGCFTLPVINTASERLVLASPGGLVVSLAPPRTRAAEPPLPPVPQPPTEPSPAGEVPPANGPEPTAADI